MAEGVRIVDYLKRVGRSSVAKYGTASIFPRVMAILAIFAITPLAIEHIGLDGYGYWVLATQIPAIVVSPDLGLTAGLINDLVRVNQRFGTLRSERQRLLDLTRLLWLLASLWFALGCILAFCYIRLSEGSESESPLLLGIVIALAIFTAGIPAMVISRAQLAQEKGHESVLWEGLGKSVALFGSLGVLLIAPNVLILIVVYMLPTTLAAWLNFRSYTRREFGGLGPVSWSPPLTVYRRNAAAFRVGKYFVIMQVSYLLSTSLDPYVVAIAKDSAAVAYVSVVRRPFDVLPLVVTLFSTALWPVFVRRYNEGNFLQLKRLVYGVGFGGSLLAVLGGVSIIALSVPLFAYLGSGQVHPATSDLVWVAVLTSASVAVIIFSNLLNALDRVKPQAWILLLSAILTLGIKVYVLSIYGLGGFFAASAASYLVLTAAPILVLTVASLRPPNRNYSSLSQGV